MKPVVVFYSPLKPPDENSASGVQQVGALYVKALRRSGFEVELPNLPSTYAADPDAPLLKSLCDDARVSTVRILDDLRDRRIVPAAWFTYHCYYKSPDVIGPEVARHLSCPYIVAEGSSARKRADGPWASHHRDAMAALARADLLLATTERDRPGLQAVASRRGEVVSFPPFVDCEHFESVAKTSGGNRMRILAAGSMRDPRKLASYVFLFDSLGMLDPAMYSLAVAGDGPGRTDLEARADGLRACGAQISFFGRVTPSKMPEFFSNGDVFAWPGLGEAYGLTYLEAQAAGLPVVAVDSGGVRASVHAGVSGVLVKSDDPLAFAGALGKLGRDAGWRRELGRSARSWVQTERSLVVAAARLRQLIERRP